MSLDLRCMIALMALKRRRTLVFWKEVWVLKRISVTGKSYAEGIKGGQSCVSSRGSRCLRADLTTSRRSTRLVRRRDLSWLS